MHALCLSAGGMFGAYQAGAWEELSKVWKPDLVVGASIGALNAYAIASGCPAAELSARWLDLRPFARHHIRIPMPPWQGLVEPDAFEAMAREMCAAMQPRMPLGIVATHVGSLQPRLFRDGPIGWEHLAASCAVPGVLPQYRVCGERYADGGLLGALPVWAAVEMGATRIVAINVMPRMPWWVRWPLVAIKKVRIGSRPRDPGVIVVSITPQPVLGGWKEASWWSRARSERYVERGRRDARLVWERIS